jgi:hypothetical protein
MRRKSVKWENLEKLGIIFIALVLLVGLYFESGIFTVVFAIWFLIHRIRTVDFMNDVDKIFHPVAEEIKDSEI